MKPSILGIGHAAAATASALELCTSNSVKARWSHLDANVILLNTTGSKRLPSNAMNLALVDPFALAQDYPDFFAGNLKSGHAFCVKFSKRGDYLAAGRADGVVVIFDIETNGIAYRLKGHTRQVQSLSWSKSGRYLLSSSQDCKCILWDLIDGSRREVIKFEAPVYLADLHPINERTFVASVFEDSAALINTARHPHQRMLLSARPLRVPLDGIAASERLSTNDLKQSTCVAIFNSSGTHVISGTTKGWIHIIDAQTGLTVYSSKICNAVLFHLRLSPSGRHIVTNSSDRIIRTMSIPDLGLPTLDNATIELREEHKFQDVVNRLSWNHVAWSFTGDFVMASTYMNHDIYVWERGHGSLVKMLEGPKEELGAVEWHPSRPMVAACGLETGAIYIWSTLTPQKWSALAPDFAEVEENVEYKEKEDEFDVHPEEEIRKRRLDLEDELVDVFSSDSAPDGFAATNGDFRMPVLLDLEDSDSEDELVLVGPGTHRRLVNGK